MTIELTENQQRAISASGDRPARLVDPTTHRSYVLVPAEVYEELRSLLDDERAEQSGWLKRAEEARTRWARENPY